MNLEMLLLHQIDLRIQVLVVTTDSNKDDWILNSGCSYHMTPNKHWFETYEEVSGGKVIMGNDAACKVVEIGTVRIDLSL